ncbi:MAG: beta-ketoacyl synthase chain length factor [Burkholderiaceae bacterium]
MRVNVLGIGLVAPGIPDWQSGAAILRGERDYVPAELGRYVVDLLPANERRRLTPTIRLALQAATDATAGRPELRAQAASVFVSESGDLAIAERMCRALTHPARTISPVDFHNSVHNAPSGYWAIASRCQAPSTSLSLTDANLAIGLLEAAMQSLVGDCPALLVAYELPPPADLAWPGCPSMPFACALLVQAGERQPGHPCLELRPIDSHGPSVPDSLSFDDPALQALSRDSAAARALPLLARLARNDGGSECLLLSYNAVLEANVIV